MKPRRTGSLHVRREWRHRQLWSKIVRLIAETATARDVATSEEWAVHNLIQGAKDSVRAQYGKDSTQVQEVGLKRASDYKTRSSKAKTAPK